MVVFSPKVKVHVPLSLLMTLFIDHTLYTGIFVNIHVYFMLFESIVLIYITVKLCIHCCGNLTLEQPLRQLLLSCSTVNNRHLLFSHFEVCNLCQDLSVSGSLFETTKFSSIRIFHETENIWYTKRDSTFPLRSEKHISMSAPQIKIHRS